MTREQVILAHIKRDGLGPEMVQAALRLRQRNRDFECTCSTIELGLIQLKELAFYPTRGSEFYIALSLPGELPAGTRLELLQQVDREQSLS
jgi:hypothetical protein